LVFAFPEDVPKGRAIFLTFWEFTAGFTDDFSEGERNLGRVDIIFSRALISDKPFFFELRELCRDPGLSHPKDLLELCDRE
jgi:hypothetical protein